MLGDMTQSQNTFSIQLGIVLGLGFYLIYSIASYFFRKRALKNIENNLLESEYILYEPKVVFSIDFLVPFGIGGFLGAYIIPFLVFPEVQMINTISRQYLSLCILAELIGIFVIFLFSSEKCVITNKRVIRAWGFKFICGLLKIKIFNKPQLETKYLNYSDVKSIEYKKIFGTDILTINLNNDKNFKLSGYKDLKDIQSIIEQYF